MKHVACFVLVLLAPASTLPGATTLKRITRGETTTAVIVPAGTSIEYTRQHFDKDPGNLLRELELPAGRALKLNVVAASPEAADAARAAIDKHFSAAERPAVSIAVGALPADYTVAIDAVVAPKADQANRGPWNFISGQAELIAKSPGDATAKTIGGLLETLEFLGCRPDDVVQAKCFLTPMSAMPVVISQFEKALPELDHRLVFVEWKSSLPVEIEMVATSPKSPDVGTPAVEYLTPPGKSASPLFARIVRVNRGGLIFIGELYATNPGDGRTQVTSIFEQLQDVLKQTGSDLRHLVKATYYVSDEDASRQLNALRPKYFDPERPPAASKAMVPAVGMKHRSISIDMIAVPATQPSR